MSRSQWYRIALSGLLFVVIAWLWATRLDELTYHTIGSSELIEIGDATAFGTREQVVPTNAYVSVTGILGNKAATLSGLRAGSFRFGRYQVRHLLGSKLYVEFDEEKYRGRFNPFTRIAVQGRLIPFGPGSELDKVRTFFKDYYNQVVDDKAMLIVVDEQPKSEIVYPIMFFVSVFVVVVSIVLTIRTLRRKPEPDYDDLE